MPSLPAIPDIFTLPAGFESVCMQVFRYQADENPVYRSFIKGLKIDPANITKPEQIPFLPVELFKSHTVQTGSAKPEVIFSSSGTEGIPSKHAVADLNVYRQSFRSGFELFYGPVTDYCVLALLPSYLEREGSSLVFMADDIIKRSNHPDSGFYLHNREELHSILLKQEQNKQRTLLLGVSYALLDFAEDFPMKLKHIIVMETGGMKGKRKEMIREELHGYLKERLGLEMIHSEYGMTELLSQAYSKGNGLFYSPPWMKVLIRDPNDPMALSSAETTGGINIIDLANIHSCSFIATQDLGKAYPDGSFEVLGRFDNSEARGCNLLVI